MFDIADVDVRSLGTQGSKFVGLSSSSFVIPLVIISLLPLICRNLSIIPEDASLNGKAVLCVRDIRSPVRGAGNKG